MLPAPALPLSTHVHVETVQMTSHSSSRRPTTEMDPRDSGPFRYLWQLSAGHRTAILFALGLSLLSSLIAVFQPRLLQTVVNDFASQRPAGTTITWLVVFTITSATLMGVQSYILQRGAESVVLSLRRRTVKKFLSMTVASHDRSNSGDLLSRATSDANAIKLMISAGIVPILGSILMLVGITAFMVLLDPVLFVVTILAVLLGFLLVVMVGKTARESSLRLQRGLGSFSIAIDRLLASIRTVKAFNAQDLEEKNVDNASLHLWRSGIQLAKLLAFVQPTINFCMQGALLLVIVLGSLRVSTGDLDLGAFLAYVMYMFMLILPISSLSQAYTQIQIGMGAIARIREIDALDDDFHVSGPASLEANLMKAPLIAFENVSFGYEEESATLANISFTVQQGENLAIVGRSGSGKTTILELLERFYEPDSGVIRFEGRDYTTISHQEYRHNFALVSQDSAVLSGTLKENLAMGAPGISDVEISAVLKAVGMEDLVGKADFALESDLGQGGVTLSGGQRQRLAWARALLSKASIVVMDEPTSSLDTITESLMQDLLREFARGRTLITVTHRLSTVRNADQILLVDGGHIVAVGKHDDLMRVSGLYRDLVSVDDRKLATV